jgi:hypothetical protein
MVPIRRFELLTYALRMPKNTVISISSNKLQQYNQTDKLITTASNNRQYCTFLTATAPKLRHFQFTLLNCFKFDKALAFPSGVRGPVLIPPWFLHLPLASAFALHG